jgi:hypothetical protein
MLPAEGNTNKFLESLIFLGISIYKLISIYTMLEIRVNIELPMLIIKIDKTNRRYKRQ